MNKLYTARLLMVISILLIIVFQVYWLGKVFNEGKNAFRKTTDLTFKETLYRLQAARFTGYTMIFKGLPGDNVFMSDVVDAVHKTRIYNKDSTKKFIISVNTNLESGVKNRRILINSKNETLAPLEKLFRENKSLNDTIPIKKIDSLYHNLLGREGITVKYRLLHSTFPGKDSMEGNYSTKKAAVGLIDPFFYRADFEDPSAYVFKKMAIQMLLSVLLIALITISFVFLYRNLVAQQKLTAIKNEFIANITHELKTPIATVSVAIEAMKNFNALQNPEQAREYLGIAAQELDRLSLLVDKVLRLSMFENRQLELKYSRFDFLELLHEVIKSMQLQFEKCNAAVNVEVTGEDFSIEADRMDITG
ncbi:MAG TPA: HAMP domain-containing sensor histidine kinase, partial [Ferruginibacter sp.]|nr:HAMP domain-containing sensor histidine kinase [Ferruginibacter sp.]